MRADGDIGHAAGRRHAVVHDGVRPRHADHVPADADLRPRAGARRRCARSRRCSRTEDDPSHDAEPGKIVHEVRTGKAAVNWFARYYGTVDATPLFLVLLSEVWRWTDDAALADELKGPALAALAWIDEWGDRDGDGFVEFERRSDHGLDVQSWKDSGDSQRFHDGTIATGADRARARCRATSTTRSAEWPRSRARRGATARSPIGSSARRPSCSARFDEAFWVEERGGFYALALDGEKRRVDSLTSNIGHLLLSRDRPARARRRGRRPADGPRALVGLGRADDVVRRRRLQPAQLPQRHRLAPRQLPDRVGPRAAGPLAGVPPDRPPDARRRRPLRLAAARGVRRPRPRRDAVPDRVPDRGAPAGLGGRHAGAAAAAPARPRARPRPAPPLHGRARAADVGGRAPRVRHPGVRPPLGRASSRAARCASRPRDERSRVVAPAWFPVPPTGYGGIEWVVWLLAEGLVDGGPRRDAVRRRASRGRRRSSSTSSPRRRATRSATRSRSSTT